MNARIKRKQKAHRIIEGEKIMREKTILTVDDEIHILELIEYNLKKNGFTVIKAESGEEALEILAREKVDLVLLDLMLGGIDGLEVLKKIRRDTELKRLPVILLTAKDGEFHKVVGLELGADDYISKPFGVHEMIARVKAVLRRSKSAEEQEEETAKENILEYGVLSVDKTKREVRVKGQKIELALKEFEILYLLMKHIGKVYSREKLLEKIWGFEYYGETRTVDVHIRNLRKKLEQIDSECNYIKTVRGVGYKLEL